MPELEIGKFKSLNEMQVSLENYIVDLKKQLESYSTAIGDKLRAEEGKQDDDLADLRERLKGPSDPKKKKPDKKTRASTWHDFGGIVVFDGVGLKGELELYFKAVEELQSKIAKLEKAKDSIANLISKGIRKDLGCVLLNRTNNMPELAFIKITNASSKKFSFKSIYTVNSEPLISAISYA